MHTFPQIHWSGKLSLVVFCVGMMSVIDFTLDSIESNEYLKQLLNQ